MWLLCLFLGRLRFSTACPAAGYATFLAPVDWPALQWRLVELAVSLVRHLVSTLCRALPPGPAVCAGYPWGGFLPFLSPGA